MEVNETVILNAFLKELSTRMVRGGCEYGGWGLDDKRPFGNSDAVGDILEIMGERPTVVAGGEEMWTAAQEVRANALYERIPELLRQALLRCSPRIFG